MSAERNIIRATVRELDGHFALVEVEHGCGRCHENGGCGGQHLTQMFCSGPKRFRVDNRLGAVPGEQVRVAVEEGALRTSANLAYGLPIFGLIGGAVLGQTLGGDLAAIGGAVVGLLGMFVLVKQRIARRPHLGASNPEIISRL